MKLKNYLNMFLKILKDLQKNKTMPNIIIVIIPFIGLFAFFQWLPYIQKSLILIPLYLLVWFIENRFFVTKGAKYAKALCYLGLGLIIIHGIFSKSSENIATEYYVATMCFIEFFDNLFEYKEGRNIKKQKL